MNLSSRKFIVTVLIYIATFTFALRGIITSDQACKLLLYIGGIYTSANVLSKLAGIIGAKKSE